MSTCTVPALTLPDCTYADARRWTDLDSPDNVDPIAAIGRLRRPGHGTTLTDEAFWQVEWREVVRAFSWPKTTEESDALSEKVYRGNMRTMDRILRQPLPDYGYLVDYSV